MSNYDKINPKNPAMPHPDGANWFPGIPIRLQIAAMVLQGLSANPTITNALKFITKDTRHSSLAETALLSADALINEYNQSIENEQQ